jgi:hypothetical protein
MAQLLHDPNYYRELAATMRSLAVRMIDAKSKALVLMLATKYDKWAERAEQQLCDTRDLRGDN